MLNRLKTLPLTILLTILIWMYAEAHFTTPEADHPLTFDTPAQATLDLPIYVSGPPALLSDCNITLQPTTTRITVAGSPADIQSLRTSNVHIFLDLTPDDHPSPTPISRRLRYVLPPNLSLQSAPTSVDFQLTEIPTATTKQNP